MPKKRTSRGRTKGGKGSSGTVHCSQCGAMVPRDKAKKVTGRITLVEPTLAKELRGSGSIYCTFDGCQILLCFLRCA